MGTFIVTLVKYLAGILKVETFIPAYGFTGFCLWLLDFMPLGFVLWLWELGWKALLLFLADRNRGSRKRDSLTSADSSLMTKPLFYSKAPPSKVSIPPPPHTHYSAGQCMGGWPFMLKSYRPKLKNLNRGWIFTVTHHRNVCMSMKRRQL